MLKKLYSYSAIFCLFVCLKKTYSEIVLFVSVAKNYNINFSGLA